MREPTDRNRIGGSHGRTSWHESAKSASIKVRGCKFGSCAQKSVKLTSEDLCRVGPTLAYASRLKKPQGFLIAAQKSAEGIVGGQGRSV